MEEPSLIIPSQPSSNNLPPNTPPGMNTSSSPQPQQKWLRIGIFAGAITIVLLISIVLRGPLLDFFITPHGLGALPPASLSPTLVPPTDTQPATESNGNTPLSHSSPTPSTVPAVYTMNVLVLSYFPLTVDGQTIDIQVTGDWGEPYQSTLLKTREQTQNLKNALEKGTKYLGYKNPAAPSSLKYTILDTKEYTTAVPMRDDGSRKPNYKGILLNHDICDLVDTQGLTEVWIWAYQGPTHPDSTYPYLNIAESKMAGPHGDISNSYREGDMPVCSKTYRVYTFNYQRGTQSALHSWGHQLESEMEAVDRNLFRTLWQGMGSAVKEKRVARCGDVHFPPNATADYEYANETPYQANCLSWNPNETVATESISCKNWGCADISDSNNAELNYLIWNMQNIPGIDNGISYDGEILSNWWAVHADFDTAMNKRTLVVR
jgi:hypothetical protein